MKADRFVFFPRFIEIRYNLPFALVVSIFTSLFLGGLTLFFYAVDFNYYYYTDECNQVIDKLMIDNNITFDSYYYDKLTFNILTKDPRNIFVDQFLRGSISHSKDVEQEEDDLELKYTKLDSRHSVESKTALEELKRLEIEKNHERKKNRYPLKISGKLDIYPTFYLKFGDYFKELELNSSLTVNISVIDYPQCFTFKNELFDWIHPTSFLNLIISKFPRNMSKHFLIDDHQSYDFDPNLKTSFYSYVGHIFISTIIIALLCYFLELLKEVLFQKFVSIFHRLNQFLFGNLHNNADQQPSGLISIQNQIVFSMLDYKVFSFLFIPFLLYILPFISESIVFTKLLAISEKIALIPQFYYYSAFIADIAIFNKHLRKLYSVSLCFITFLLISFLVLFPTTCTISVCLLFSGCFIIPLALSLLLEYFWLRKYLPNMENELFTNMVITQLSHSIDTFFPIKLTST
eukprot:TRINITY_DN1576_c0_g1_i1.p1 TRINITY_DN1576_c0_g1~~TRINITY_DN1576_c0_g1_i1.p1  ORF type:complete len:461 (-),score=94.05 TRINITY_DN1576_c0_g1_i1:7-1389(-)